MTTIVAGYDGSPDSGAAVRWAAVEARARDAVLVVCSAGDPETLRRGMGCAHTLLEPGRVESVLLRGSPVTALINVGATAEMVVVGARGQGGLPRLLLGSVPTQLASHCPVPLIVVRAPARAANASAGPVLAGVDGSPGSAAAVKFALQLAELHSLPLTAVCALADAPGSLAGSRRLEEEFGTLMDRLEKDYPDVPVLRDVLPGAARTSLLRMTATTRAGLVVLGTRGRGGFATMPLGSVAQALLQYAPCPVALVPADRQSGRLAL